MGGPWAADSRTRCHAVVLEPGQLRSRSIRLRGEAPRAHGSRPWSCHGRDQVGVDARTRFVVVNRGWLCHRIDDRTRGATRLLGTAAAQLGAMSLKGILSSGNSCKITIACAPTMPGTSAVAITWIPKPGAVAPVPIVAAIAPGMKIEKAMPVPAAQMLLIDVDVPVDQASTMTITVDENAKTVATGTEDSDTEWTFLVQP